MRAGVPMAGNHLMQELAIMTGAVEMMLVDYQCIMPAVTRTAGCYHTKVVSSFDKARFPGAEHISFDPEHGREIGRKMVSLAIENFANRDNDRVVLPSEATPLMAGFSVEAVVGALGGTPEPLIDAIKDGTIRGVAGIVGCKNPKVKHDLGHTKLARELIKRDILVGATGCAGVAIGKAKMMQPEAADMCGPGLRGLCQALGVPPVLHMGSCVDNTRIVNLAATLANALDVDISDLPIAGAAPEWYSEKALSIGLYMVASGVTTVLGVAPPIFGSAKVTQFLTRGAGPVLGATFAVEPDPVKAADIIEAHIEKKRAGLGLDSR